MPIPPHFIRDIFELPFYPVLTNKDKMYKEYVIFLHFLLQILGYKTKSYVDLVEFLEDYENPYNPVYKKIQQIYKKFHIPSKENFKEFIEYCFKLFP
jgi:hypothetical protein